LPATKTEVEVGQDVVEELDVGMRRVDVYGTELIAEEEAARGDDIDSCFAIGIPLSVDCGGNGSVAVAFAADEGIIESADEVEMPVRVRVPNAESVMVMGKLTPDDCHRV
jgi:hypothetical protein